VFLKLFIWLLERFNAFQTPSMSSSWAIQVDSKFLVFFFLPISDLAWSYLQFLSISSESRTLCENMLNLEVLCLSALSIALRFVYSPTLYMLLSRGRCWSMLTIPTLNENIKTKFLLTIYGGRFFLLFFHCFLLVARQYGLQLQLFCRCSACQRSRFCLRNPLHYNL
jgi:hypothetical protein